MRVFTRAALLLRRLAIIQAVSHGVKESCATWRGELGRVKGRVPPWSLSDTRGVKVHVVCVCCQHDGNHGVSLKLKQRVVGGKMVRVGGC